MESVWRQQAIVVLAAAVVLLSNLGGAGLWDRDEPRNAGCAREMLARGDWVVPTFNEELRAHKPVLLYWLIMGSYLVFGVGEFAARLPSALLGVGTVLLVFHLGRRLYGRDVGFWAALILATSLMFDVAARAATPDASLIFFCTLALFLFVRGCQRAATAHDSQPARPISGGAAPWKASLPGWRSFVWIYAAMGLGVLAKGPVAVALPTMAIGLFLLLVLPYEAKAPTGSLASRLKFILGRFGPRRVARTIWAMRPLTALAVVSLIALPWYVAVDVRTDGAFSREFFGTHNVARFTGSMENHRGPIFYYLIAILLGMLPGSVFMGPTLLRMVRRIRQHHAWRESDILLVAWAGTIVGFFSLAGTKLPSYVLPAYPALALLIGALVAAWLQEPVAAWRVWFRIAMGCVALLGIAMLVGLPIAAHLVLPGEALLGALGILPLLGSAVCLWLVERGRARAAMRVFTIGSVVTLTAALGFAAARVDRHQNSKPLLAIVHQQKTADRPRIATYRHFRSTYVYYARQRVETINHPRDVKQFFRSGEESYLIVPESELPSLAAVLPADIIELTRQPWFLKTEDLLLLAHPASPPSRTAEKPPEQGNRSRR